MLFTHHPKSVCCGFHEKWKQLFEDLQTHTHSSVVCLWIADQLIPHRMLGREKKVSFHQAILNDSFVLNCLCVLSWLLAIEREQSSLDSSKEVSYSTQIVGQQTRQTETERIQSNKIVVPINDQIGLRRWLIVKVEMWLWLTMELE